jgi:hypothetical protein
MIALSLRKLKSKRNLSIHRFKSEGFYQIYRFVRQNVQEINYRIALTDKFLIIAAHHCIQPSAL